jgi:cytochrome c556
LFFITDPAKGKIMKKIKNIMILGFVLILTSPGAMAADKEELIEARQGLMKLYDVNMEILYDMISRKQPYDKNKAKATANNLLALSKLEMGSLWPIGTSVEDKGFENLTAAKPDIWLQKEQVAQEHDKLVKSLEVLANDAAWSLEYLRDAFNDVGDNCKSCHKSYRAKK